jgi:phosphoribosyl 1,2-cyclic phosphate phosphodiesterase
MKVTVLGTGTSQGVPVIACQCAVCQSSDQHDKRLRSAVMIYNDSTCLVVDAGADFRQQMLTYQVKKIDGLLITHGHKDHTGGLDDVRAFNWVMKKPIDIWARKDVLNIVKKEFPYAFGEDKYPGAPEINLHIIDDDDIFIGNMRIIPVKAFHGKLPVTGFRIGAFSYLTDASKIETKELNKMKGSRFIVINALRQEKHHSHFSLDEAIDILQQLAPEKGYITHISHQMGFHNQVQQMLPKNIFLAYDGLEIIV